VFKEVHGVLSTFARDVEKGRKLARGGEAKAAAAGITNIHCNRHASEEEIIKYRVWKCFCHRAMLFIIPSSSYSSIDFHNTHATYETVLTFIFSHILDY
jgi:hypothetical protein